MKENTREIGEENAMGGKEAKMFSHRVTQNGPGCIVRLRGCSLPRRERFSLRVPRSRRRSHETRKVCTEYINC